MPYTTNVPGTTITAAWGNANVRDQVVTPFGSVSARSSAITSPIDGMISTLTDHDVADLYDGATWVPIGPTVTDACAVTAASPFVSGVAFGTEAEISTKFRLTLPKVRANDLWLIGIHFLYNQSGTGTDLTFRWREDNTSGTVIRAGYLAAVSTNINTFMLLTPWVPSADATSKVLVCTLTRNTGTATTSIYNLAGSDSANAVFAGRVGKAASIRSVA